MSHLSRSAREIKESAFVRAVSYSAILSLSPSPCETVMISVIRNEMYFDAKKADEREREKERGGGGREIREGSVSWKARASVGAE